MARIGARRITVLAILVIAIITSSIGNVSAWSRNNAVQYADSHWNIAVPGTDKFSIINGGGGDCTNFVSQSLKLGGGMSMTNAWYYNNNNDYSIGWSSVGSFRWAAVNSGRAVVYNIPAGQSYLLYSTGYIDIGDVIQMDFNNDGAYDHTVLITGITLMGGYGGLPITYHFEYTAHENNQKHYPLDYVIRDNPGYRFRVIHWVI